VDRGVEAEGESFVTRDSEQDRGESRRNAPGSTFANSVEWTTRTYQIRPVMNRLEAGQVSKVTPPIALPNNPISSSLLLRPDVGVRDRGNRRLDSLQAGPHAGPGRRFAVDRFANANETRVMSDSISQIWSGLRDAGMPEVMLFLPDGTASRSHWDETAMIGPTRVALLGDQERKIVRVVPVESCVGIGVACPKGIDTSCFRSMVQSKLSERFQRPVPTLRPVNGVVPVGRT
jgi:hypothetical protein